MPEWHENILLELADVNDEKILLQSLANYAREINFDYLSYVLSLSYPASSAKLAFLDNYPENWKKTYVQQKYLELDPIVQRGLDLASPFTWNAEINSKEATTKSEEEFWQQAITAGLRFGWSHSYHELTGTTGVITLARSTQPICEEEMRSSGVNMFSFAGVVHSLLSRCLAKRIFPSVRDLSEREIEMLRWTSAGKTAVEISELTGIAERTVNFHLNNAMLKLQAVNKTAAVVQSSYLGILRSPKKPSKPKR